MRFKKVLTALLSVVLMLSAIPTVHLSVVAETYGLFTYEINDNEVTITACDSEAAGDIVIPSSINGKPVKNIADRAFLDCKYIETVTLPKALTTIGVKAFSACVALKEITIPGTVESIGNYAFDNCISLQTVTLKSGTKIIGKQAFKNCQLLESINIPNSVTQCMADAFADCISLKRVDISNLSLWCEIKFDNEYANPLYLAHDLYLSGNLLNEIRVPKGITNVKSYTFAGSSAEKITLLDGMLKVSPYSFMGCALLKEITLPESVDYLGRDAFRDCTSLEKIVINGVVKYIYVNTFYNCTALKYVNLSNDLVAIQSNAFYNCSALEKIYLPTKLSYFESNAFYGCTNLKEVYYGGSTANWESVNKNTGNTAITSSKIYYEKSKVPSTAIKLYISQMPTKLSYVYGEEELDLTGGKLVVVYDYGGNKEMYLKNAKIEGFDNKTYGLQKIKASYSGCSTEFLVNIVEGKPKYDILAPGDFGGDGHFKADDLILARKVLFTQEYDLDAHRLIDCTGDEHNDICDLVRLKKHILNDTGSEQFTYEVIGDTAVITGYKGEASGPLTFPESIEGYIVSKIGDNAFKNCENITSILFPATVVEIGKSAFEGCTSLSNIALPDSIEIIGERAFAGCASLNNIALPLLLTHIGASAFENCFALSSIKVPYYTTFGENVFTNCSSLVVKGFTEASQNAADESDVDFIMLDCDHATTLFIGYIKADCTNKGSTGQEICRECGFIVCEALETPETEHTLVVVNRKEPTDDEEGETGEEVCVQCSNTVKKSQKIPAGHKHSLTLVGVIKATCSSGGYTGDKICSCGYTERGTATSPTAHDTYTDFQVKKCTVDGYMIKKCKNCSFEKQISYEPAEGHKFGDEWFVSKQPTCTESGVEYQRCSVCSATRERAIEPTGHSAAPSDKYIAPTCVDAGYQGDYECAYCGEMLSEKYLPALGHSCYPLTICHHEKPKENGDFVGWYDDYVEEYSACIRCSFTESKIVAKGYSVYYINKYKGDCCRLGYNEYDCRYCDFKHRDYTDYGMHEWRYYTVSEPTCTSVGMTAMKCEVCHAYDDINIVPALGHSPTLENQKEAFCFVAGYTGDEVCTRCDTVLSTGEVIPALNHNYAPALEPIAVTCTTDGYSGHYVCLRCKELTYGYTIPATGHKRIEMDNGKAPTCTATGKTGDFRCGNCNILLESAQTIPALGHSMGTPYYVCNHKLDFYTWPWEGHYTYEVTPCTRCSYTTRTKIASGRNMYTFREYVPGPNDFWIPMVGPYDPGYYSCKYCDYVGEWY